MKIRDIINAHNNVLNTIFGTKTDWWKSLSKEDKYKLIADVRNGELLANKTQ